jgi:hypothetical protein
VSPSAAPPPTGQFDGRDVAVALRVREQAADGARNLIEALGIAAYLGQAGVEGMAAMAEEDAAALEAGDVPASPSDLHAALVAVLPDLGIDELLDAYATAYISAPDSFMGQLLAERPIVADTPMTRLELWGMFVDGFVTPALAVEWSRAASLVPVAPAPRSRHTPGLNLPRIPSPDPSLDSFEYTLLLSQLPALAYAIPFEMRPSTASGHESHGAPGPTLEVTARHQPGYSPPVSPHTGIPLLLPASRGLSGLPVTWNSTNHGLFDAHGSVVTPFGTVQPSDATGASTFRYQLRRERGDQSGPVLSDVASVTASVALRDLLLANYAATPSILGFALGDRIVHGIMTIEWHQADWYINEPFVTGIGSGHIIGQKCDGATGQWQAEGVYDAADAHGNQNWNIDLSMQSGTSGRGLFTYSDVQEMPAIGGITVITVGNVRGEVTLTIASDTGVATMNMRETQHTFTSTTSVGGSGHEQNAPLQSYSMTWQPGDPDDVCDPPPP